MALLTFKNPTQVVFPQFNNQAVVITYGQESYSLSKGEGNKYLVKCTGCVVTVLNEEDRNVSKYSYEDAVSQFIRFIFLGVKFKGCGMKGKAFIADADHGAINDAQQLRVMNTILCDHNINLKF